MQEVYDLDKAQDDNRDGDAAVLFEVSDARAFAADQTTAAGAGPSSGYTSLNQPTHLVSNSSDDDGKDEDDVMADMDGSVLSGASEDGVT